MTNPAGATIIRNGQIECFGSAFQTYEQGKLYGTTFSLLHLFGNNLLDFWYDFHGQSTFAYINSPTPPLAVPFSTNRYSTFSLTVTSTSSRTSESTWSLQYPLDR